MKNLYIKFTHLVLVHISIRNFCKALKIF